MSLSIIKPGLLDTVQDLGRHGYSHWGINPGGAMDVFAAQVANMLVGNCATEAVIEMHFPGPQILFNQNTLIAIAGADFSPCLNEEPLPLWTPIVVRRNTVLQFHQLKKGAVAYLAIHGGMAVEKWLGSYSTNLKAAAGGVSGRQLKKGDDLCFKDNHIYFAGMLREQDNLMPLQWRVNVRKTYKHPHEIFIMKGNEWEYLTGASQYDFLQNDFIVHPSSDRMGYQLRGNMMQTSHPVEMVSCGVSYGTLQLLPDGHLIALMADHQTTGGYPRIAHVIAAHLPKLSQLRPSDNVQFKLVDFDVAEKMFLSQQNDLHILERACKEHLNALVC